MPNAVTTAFQSLAERSEEALSRRGDAGKIVVQIGSATCEHAAGSREVADEFVKHLASSGRTDVVLHRTGCTGRCSKEPIVGISVPGKPPVKYERVDRELVHKIFTSHVQKGVTLPEHALDGSLETPYEYELVFCEGRRCKQRTELKASFEAKLAAAGIGPDRVKVNSHACLGVCSEETEGKSTRSSRAPSATGRSTSG